MFLVLVDHREIFKDVRKINKIVVGSTEVVRICQYQGVGNRKRAKGASKRDGKKLSSGHAPHLKRDACPMAAKARVTLREEV